MKHFQLQHTHSANGYSQKRTEKKAQQKQQQICENKQKYNNGTKRKETLH